MPWSTLFEDPVPLPVGRQLLTLRDAPEYIAKLLEAEHTLPEWQAAMEALILFAENGGPTMLARIGIMRALSRGHIREFNPNRKDHHWGRRIQTAEPTGNLFDNLRERSGGFSNAKSFRVLWKRNLAELRSERLLWLTAMRMQAHIPVAHRSGSITRRSFTNKIAKPSYPYPTYTETAA